MPEWVKDVGIEVPALFIALIAILIIVTAFIRYLGRRDKQASEMAEACHAVQAQGHAVMHGVATSLGESIQSTRMTREMIVESNRETREVLRDLATYVKRANGHSSGSSGNAAAPSEGTEERP